MRESKLPLNIRETRLTAAMARLRLLAVLGLAAGRWAPRLAPRLCGARPRASMASLLRLRGGAARGDDSSYAGYGYGGEGGYGEPPAAAPGAYGAYGDAAEYPEEGLEDDGYADYYSQADAATRTMAAARPQDAARAGATRAAAGSRARSALPGGVAASAQSSTIAR